MDRTERFKKKLPLHYRFLRWLFPKVEFLFPFLAEKWAVRLFFHPLKFPMPEREKEVIGKANRFQLTVANKKVECFTLGKGKAVIFVHGWSGRGSQFWKFMQKFSEEGYKVITFDAPAHGFSEGKTTSVLEFSEVIDQLVSTYKPEILIGHSLGGVASLLSITKGVPVKNLVMIGSPSLEEKLLKEFIIKINGGETAANGIRKYVKKTTQRPLTDWMSLNLIDSVKDINLKLIHDQDDREVTLDHALALHEKYPKASLYTTEGQGHTRILSSDEAIEEALKFANQI